jgi:hypothetical protein
MRLWRLALLLPLVLADIWYNANDSAVSYTGNWSFDGSSMVTLDKDASAQFTFTGMFCLFVDSELGLNVEQERLWNYGRTASLVLGHLL